VGNFHSEFSIQNSIWDSDSGSLANVANFLDFALTWATTSVRNVFDMDGSYSSNLRCRWPHIA
jgi:hypothetical protein